MLGDERDNKNMKSNIYNELRERYWRTRDTLAVLMIVVILVGSVYAYVKGNELRASLEVNQCLIPN